MSRSGGVRQNFPEARRTTSAGINAITTDDINSFYKNNIRDKEIIIAFAGDFRPAQALALLKKSFKDWKGNAPAKVNVPKAALAAKPGELARR